MSEDHRDPMRQYPLERGHQPENHASNGDMGPAD